MRTFEPSAMSTKKYGRNEFRSTLIYPEASSKHKSSSRSVSVQPVRSTVLNTLAVARKLSLDWLNSASDVVLLITSFESAKTSRLQLAVRISSA